MCVQLCTSAYDGSKGKKTFFLRVSLKTKNSTLMWHLLTKQEKTMRLRESKPVLISGYCLGLLEHGDLKTVCTNNIWDCFFLSSRQGGSIVGLLGWLEDAEVCIIVVLVGHQSWCWGIVGGSDRRTHPQMSLLASCKPHRTVGLGTLQAYLPSDRDSGPWPTFLVIHATSTH